jgi:hypothetical protein
MKAGNMHFQIMKVRGAWRYRHINQFMPRFSSVWKGKLIDNSIFQSKFGISHGYQRLFDSCGLCKLYTRVSKVDAEMSLPQGMGYYRY